MRPHRTGQRLAAFLVAGLVLPALLRAAPLYVVEQLMVNVTSAPDASGERVATLKSGDRVEELERTDEQVHVRLASGREGWVRASYLSATEPLRVRLSQREAEVARLNDEVSALKAQLHSSAATAPVASAAENAVTPAALAARPVAEDPAAAAPAPLFSGAEQNARPSWPWTLAAALIGFGGGFGLGALMLDRHIRRKYGGLRIY
jgi:hypothetical protein